VHLDDYGISHTGSAYGSSGIYGRRYRETVRPEVLICLGILRPATDRTIVRRGTSAAREGALTNRPGR
jgi:hypothetical protein